MTNKTDYQLQVINRIKALRQQHNISQKGIADMLDISSGEVGNIESLKYKNKYTLPQLIKISKAFKVPIASLLYEIPPDNVSVDEVMEVVVRYLE